MIDSNPGVCVPYVYMALGESEHDSNAVGIGEVSQDEDRRGVGLARRGIKRAQLEAPESIADPVKLTAKPAFRANVDFPLRTFVKHANRVDRNAIQHDGRRDTDSRRSFDPAIHDL